MYPELGRFLYAPEGDKGSGDADAIGNRGAGDGNPDPKAGETITKAEAEKMLKARLERERAKYADYETSKSRLAELESQLAEREKQDLESKGKYDEALQQTIKRHQAELEKLNADRNAWHQRYESLAIDNAVLVEAQKMNALDPNDVLALVRSRVKLGADGVPSFDDGKSISDGVKAFLDSKPHLVKAASRGGSGTNHSASGTGGLPAGLADKPLSQMTREEVRQLGGKGLIERVQQQNATPWARPAKS